MDNNRARKKRIDTLSRKKMPTDHTNQYISITKKVIHHHDYESLVTPKKYVSQSSGTHVPNSPIDALEAKIDSAGERLISGIVKEQAYTGAVAVRKTIHTHSPYVISLKKNELTRPQQAQRALPAHADWLSEVDRLRKGITTRYTSAESRHTVNFLHAQKKKKRPKKISQQPLEKKQVLYVSYIVGALRAIVQWLFDLALSIPLAFLIVLHMLLRIYEAVHALMLRITQALGKGISHGFVWIAVSILALLKIAIVIPIKITSIGFLLVYRIFSWCGYWIARMWANTKQVLLHIARTIAHPPAHFYRRVLAATVLATMFILPFKIAQDAPRELALLKGRVLGATKEGYGALLGVTGASAGVEQWSMAQQKFAEARQTVDSLNVVMRGLILVAPAGSDGLHAIRAGEEIAKAGEYLHQALAPIRNPVGSTLSPIQIITALSTSLRNAKPHIDTALSELNGIDIQHVPLEYQEQFSRALQLLPAVRVVVADFLDFSDVLYDLLGGNGTRKYAVLFQNNNELRPAGGFIGSLALLDIHQGVIERMDIPSGGSYDFKGSLTEHVIAPKPLQLVNAHWELQDANWYPDWPTSAEKVAWFLEKSGNDSVDGVIAMQATTLEKLLQVLGPIDFPEYGVTLDAENVIREMQIAVELTYDKAENKPKQYVAELVPRVIERILASKPEELSEIVALLLDEIHQKNVLIYSRDKKINQAFLDRNLEPRIVASSVDYVSVVDANIGGGKTDGVIHKSWDYEVTIEPDGSAHGVLSVVRKHMGNPEDIFEKTNNVNYLRAYVPRGSVLLSADGFKQPQPSMFEEPEAYYTPDKDLAAIEGAVLIDEKTGTRINTEFNKTVFGNWTQAEPGNVVLARYSYDLPFRIKPYDILNPDATPGYSLIMQKQPGARPVDYLVTIRYPKEWIILWKKSATGVEGSVVELGNGIVTFDGLLTGDTGFGIVFSKE